MSIKILPPQLANQIAAGEVVERPSSVVKELVENALDAGAQKIEIEIERGGHKKILIKDDGKGIPKDELALALSRHATSKISDIEDLEAIMSLGFRGEALASISSVSRLTITSKPKSQSEAWSAIAEGLDMAVDVKPAAHPNGSSVEVVDLFFNTPARRKFLRAEKTEFGHIETLIKRIAMSRPEITFVLKHNGKIVKRYRSQAHLNEVIEQHAGRIAEVINQQFVDNTSSRTTTYDEIKMAVWVREPNTCRTVSPAQYAFVNGRMMRDKLIQHAIRQAYADLLQPEQQPEYVLFIELPATDVDVNVHPAKHEVRFHHARLLHDLIVSSFQECLEDFNQTQHDLSDSFETTNAPSSAPDWLVTPQQGYKSTENQTGGQLQNYSALSPKSNSDKTEPAIGQQDLVSSHAGSDSKDDKDYQHAVMETQVNKLELDFTQNNINTSADTSSDTNATSHTQPLIKPNLTQLQLDKCVEPTSQLHSYSNNEVQANLSQRSAEQVDNGGLQIVESDEDSLFIKLDNELWLVDLNALYDKTVGSQNNANEQPEINLTAEQMIATPLLVPVRIRLSDTEKAKMTQWQPLLNECGFVFKLHNEFLIIKQVPSAVRSKNANRYLPQLFEDLFLMTELTQVSVMRLLMSQGQTNFDTSKINKAQFVSNLAQVVEELRIIVKRGGKDSKSGLHSVAYRLNGSELLTLLKSKQ